MFVSNPVVSLHEAQVLAAEQAVGDPETVYYFYGFFDGDDSDNDHCIVTDYTTGWEDAGYVLLGQYTWTEAVVEDPSPPEEG